MFGLFKRRKEKVSALEGVWHKWGKAIEAKHMQWANSLKIWSDGYSIYKKRIVLIVFCLVFGLYAVFVGFEAVKGRPAAIHVDQIQVPKNINLPDSGAKQNIHHP